MQLRSVLPLLLAVFFLALVKDANAGMAFKVSDRFCDDNRGADGESLCTTCSTPHMISTYGYTSTTSGMCYECEQGTWSSSDADKIAWDKIVKKCCYNCGCNAGIDHSTTGRNCGEDNFAGFPELVVANKWCRDTRTVAGATSLETCAELVEADPECEELFYGKWSSSTCRCVAKGSQCDFPESSYSNAVWRPKLHRYWKHNQGWGRRRLLSNAQAGVGVGYHRSNSNACIDDIYSKGSHRTATWKFCRQSQSWCTDRAQIDAQHAALKASLCSPSCIGPCDATQPVLGAANTYAPTYGAWGQRRLLSSQTNHSTSGEDHGHPGTAPPEDAAEAAALLNAHSDDLLALLADATHNVPDDPLLLMADATRADTKAEAKVAWDCG